MSIDFELIGIIFSATGLLLCALAYRKIRKREIDAKLHELAKKIGERSNANKT